MDRTPRVGLPLLSAGQMQKEVWHNEGLLLIDALVGGAIDGMVRSMPPPMPDQGVWYRTSPSPGDAWTDYSDMLASMTEAGWRFVAPFEGLELRGHADGKSWRYTGGDWEIGVANLSEIRVDGDRVVGPRADAIGDPSGGGTVDEEARSAIRDVLAALRGHGLIG